MPSTQMWVSKLQSPIKGTRAPWRRQRLTAGQGQGKHKISLEYLVVLEEVLLREGDGFKGPKSQRKMLRMVTAGTI